MTLPDRCCYKTLEAHAVRASLPSVHSHLHFPPRLSTAGLLNARCVTQTSGQQLLSPKVSQDSLTYNCTCRCDERNSHVAETPFGTAHFGGKGGSV